MITAILRQANVPVDPEREYRRSFLLLRWLLFVLAAYLTLFSYLHLPQFVTIVVFAAVFACSNLVCSLAPRDWFVMPRFQTAIVIADILLVSATFHFLRVPGTHLHAAFAFVFVLIVFWRDLRVVGVSLLGVSLSYGVFSTLKLLGMLGAAGQSPVDVFVVGDEMERFLALALYFVVSIFYLFLGDQLQKHAVLTSVANEENRRTEVMAEIARSISLSLNSDEILRLIVSRIRDVFASAECSIVSLNSRSPDATILASHQAHPPQASLALEAHPELQKAFETRELVFLQAETRDGVTGSRLAMPMLANDAVVGVIHIGFGKRLELSESDRRFFRVMSMTGATALRNAQLFEEMAHRARTDFLTDLPNHRFFQFTLSSELARAYRHNHPLSLLIIDLDYLKDVNDRFGHPTGDLVIKMAGEAIRSNCRQTDFPARYGGEEFAVVLPETPLTGAIEVAERIRQKLADAPLPGVGSVTASIGVANYPINALGKEDLIRVADKALYRAKDNGRDRVEYFLEQLVTRTA
jgi:diguanylate cyclase (GGDEF)-like protein